VAVSRTASGAWWGGGSVMGAEATVARSIGEDFDGGTPVWRMMTPT
jgi:hypothetical protein